MTENEKRLAIIDGETLMDTRLEPVKFCVETLLPQGIAILGGAPKTGKSWLVLDLCVKIAKGEKVWGFDTNQGSTLYLCLEDNLQRIQNRLLDITDDVPGNAFFATTAGTIAEGLTEQIETFVSEHPNTVFIAIDTFQMVRQTTGDSSYANDYQDIVLLKNLADKLGICLLLVHHLRKQGDSDPFNKISGTTGISGAVDSAFVLERSKRNQGNATLICTGRDIEHRELELCFEKETHQWELVADSLEEPTILLDPEVNLFREFMYCISSFNGSNTELADLYSRETQKVTSAKSLKQMMNRHRFELEDMGVFFESKRSNGQRYVDIWYQEKPSNSKSDSAAIDRTNTSATEVTQVTQNFRVPQVTETACGIGACDAKMLTTPSAKTCGTCDPCVPASVGMAV